MTFLTCVVQNMHECKPSAVTSQQLTSPLYRYISLTVSMVMVSDHSVDIVEVNELH